MTNEVTSQRRWARLAGFLYLVTYAVPIAGMAISGRYTVAGNFNETAQRVASSELAYRVGLSLVLLNALLCILLAMSLYATVKPIDSTLALFGLLFRLGENVLAAMFSTLSFVAARAYTGGSLATVFTAGQLSSGMALLDRANGTEFNIAMIFLGIGSAFFFYVFSRSAYIPKRLSLLSLCACPIFVAVSFAFLCLPNPSVYLRLGWLPMALAEISLGLWLLIKGIDLHTDAPANETGAEVSVSPRALSSLANS